MSDEQQTAVVDAEAVEEEPDAQDGDERGEGMTTEALVRTAATQGEVMRPLDGGALVESFQEYQKLRGQLLTADDYQSAGSNKRFVKKSGWRKIATAFGLNLELVRSVIERAEDGSPTRAEVWARAIAPNGRFADGDGYCDVSEDRFSGPRGNKSKLENDLRGTAATRATNRAISNLVGMGEVSAEEVGQAGQQQGPEWGPEAAQEQVEACQRALTYLATEYGTVDPGPLLDSIESSYGYKPNAALGALVLLAKQVQKTKTTEGTADGD